LVQQKIVIKVQMSCDKCRSKALAVVAATGGVDSVAIDGEGRDKVVVVGDVDSVKLTSALRKKVGPAHLLQVGEAKKDDKTKPPAAVVPAYYYPPPHPVTVVYDHPAGYSWYGYQAQQDTSCSIM
jgi:hypothetical protein